MAQYWVPALQAWGFSLKPSRHTCAHSLYSTWERKIHYECYTRGTQNMSNTGLSGPFSYMPHQKTPSHGCQGLGKVWTSGIRGSQCFSPVWCHAHYLIHTCLWSTLYHQPHLLVVTKESNQEVSILSKFSKNSTSIPLYLACTKLAFKWKGLIK